MKRRFGFRRLQHKRFCDCCQCRRNVQPGRWIENNEDYFGRKAEAEERRFLANLAAMPHHEAIAAVQASSPTIDSSVASHNADGGAQ